MGEKMAVVSLIMIVFVIWIIYSSLGDFLLERKVNKHSSDIHDDWLKSHHIYEKEENLKIEKCEENADQITKERYIKGEDYFYGKNGKPQDYQKAYFYYEKAGALGHHMDALYKAGYILYYILDLDNKAFGYFKAAALKGHVEAQRLLGECYMYEIGTSRDVEAAAIWSLKAIKNGSIYAYRTLGDVCAVNSDYDGAYYWYKKAADHGDKSAMLDLAFCHYNGHGVERNVYTDERCVSIYKTAYNNHEIRMTARDKGNMDEIEGCISRTKNRIVQIEREAEKMELDMRKRHEEEKKQLRETPITGDFFAPNMDGYCIHMHKYSTCRYCARRSWEDDHWEDGYSCRIIKY